jgi:uncharacterized protein (TIGR00255 family)
MSLQSMTGFARVEGSHGAHRWHWELKSVNGKGLDCRFRLPSGFETIEQPLRDALAKHLRRGNCQAGFQLDRTVVPSKLQVNETVLNDVLVATKLVQAAAASQGVEVRPATTEGLLGLRGVLETVDVEEGEQDQSALHAAVVASFAEVASALAEARNEEGAKLTDVIKGQVDRISELTEQAAASPASSPDAMRTRLASQVNELLTASPALSEERLAQEAALLATKADIREEIDRLVAHVAQANELISSGEPVGRRLDFLTQEFNREANTLCAKSAETELTRIGLELKAAIDQLKEQVQNVE